MKQKYRGKKETRTGRKRADMKPFVNTVCGKDAERRIKIDRYMDNETRRKNRRGGRMVKNRPAHCSTLYNVQCFSPRLTCQPIPCDRLMDVQKGALILFCQGLAATQGLFSINKQE